MDRSRSHYHWYKLYKSPKFVVADSPGHENTRSSFIISLRSRERTTSRPFQAWTTVMFYKEKLRPETSSSCDFNINVIFGVKSGFLRNIHILMIRACVDALIVPLDLSSVYSFTPTVVYSMVLWSILSSNNAAVTLARFK